MKIITVVGARPQFIKAAVVSRAIEAWNRQHPAREIQELIVHTGQHFDLNMSDVFFDEMGLRRPDRNLGVASLPHGAMTGRMLEGIERVVADEMPDWLLVYGDTDSTLAGALAAAKLHVPVAHVEAGLRSFNRRMPEEINRVIADRLAGVLFAPTEVAVSNLLREGIPERSIHRVGDVMFDASRYYGTAAQAQSRILERLELAPRNYVLATIHRAENTDDGARLAGICEGLTRVAATLPVVLPLHPRTRGALQRAGLWSAPPGNIRMIEPVGYLDMVMLEKQARAVVTDSGGVQKEAFFYRVPCITVRKETEWVELVELGWNRLAPPEAFATPDTFLEWALSHHQDGSEAMRPYGDGHAGERIVGVLAAAGESPS